MITTQRQVAYHAKEHETREITVKGVIEGEISPEEISQWLLNSNDELPLVYSTKNPELVSEEQQRYGMAQASQALENFFAEVVRLAVANGVTRVISAGGETSSAIVERLNLSELQIGPEIDPGIPALRATENLVMSLKSGSFGADDFFAKANVLLAGES